MTKYLKDILGEDFMKEVYTPFPDDEKRFYQKHGLELGKEGEPPIKFPRFENMYSKDEYDKLFKGSTTMHDRTKDREGYNPGKDAEHYESVADLFNTALPGIDDCKFAFPIYISETNRVEFTKRQINELVDVIGEEGLNFISAVAEKESLSEREALHKMVDAARKAGSAVAGAGLVGTTHGVTHYATGYNPTQNRSDGEGRSSLYDHKDGHDHEFLDILAHHTHSGPIAGALQTATIGPHIAAAIQSASLIGHLGYHMAKNAHIAMQKSGRKADVRRAKRNMLRGKAKWFKTPTYDGDK